MTPSGAGDPARSFWSQVEQRAREIAQAEIALALQNLRPGGLTPVAVTVGSPTASTTVPIAHIDIPFPGKIRKISFRSTVAGSATLDVKLSQFGADSAVSILRGGDDYPAIIAATDAVVLPPTALPGWITFVAAGTTMYFYLRTCSGFDVLTVNVWLQATQS